MKEVLLVTGSSGIAAATARLWAAENPVLVVGINPEECRSLATELREASFAEVRPHHRADRHCGRRLGGERMSPVKKTTTAAPQAKSPGASGRKQRRPLQTTVIGSHVADWIKAGSFAVGVGCNLTAGAGNDDFASITQLAKQFVDRIKQARGQDSRG